MISRIGGEGTFTAVAIKLEKEKDSGTRVNISQQKYNMHHEMKVENTHSFYAVAMGY